MKFFVVSEEEIARLKSALRMAYASWTGTEEEQQYAREYAEQAEAACRAREVREVDLELLLDLPRPNPRLTKVWKEIEK